MKQIITSKMVNEWIDLYNQNYSLKQIADKYGLSSSNHVRYYLNQCGINTPPKTKYNVKDKYTLCLYDKEDFLKWQFNNCHEMSKVLNISITTIRNALSRNTKIVVQKQKYKIIKIDTTKEE